MGALKSKSAFFLIFKYDIRLSRTPDSPDADIIFITDFTKTNLAGIRIFPVSLIAGFSDTSIFYVAPHGFFANFCKQCIMGRLILFA